ERWSFVDGLPAQTMTDPGNCALTPRRPRKTQSLGLAAPTRVMLRDGGASTTSQGRKPSSAGAGLSRTHLRARTYLQAIALTSPPGPAYSISQVIASLMLARLAA